MELKNAMAGTGFPLSNEPGRGMTSREAAVKRFWIFLAAFLLLAGMSTGKAFADDPFDVLFKLQDTPSLTVWRIEAPNPKKHSTDYPTIVFKPGDSVSIDAGGCVQTGGIGPTWKRYVNPSGPESDHEYHGLIEIPGVTKGLIRLKDFQLESSHAVSIPANSGDVHLTLGYEDDGYSNNGYYKHDDGTSSQCKNVGKAFVVLAIAHNGASAPPASSFYGIAPGAYICTAAWAFHNFNTDPLSLDSFRDAFDLGAEYADLFTWLVFAATRYNLASNGNCMGMSYLSVVAEDQFIIDDLQEFLEPNYPNRTVTKPKVTKDINTAHWAQLSATFLHDYLANVFRSPEENAKMIEADLTKPNMNYGLVSIAHGTDGHVLVPLSVGHSGSTTIVTVYDPNRECPAGDGPAQIVINGSRWSFQMDSGEVWSGSTGNDGLSYVPYLGSKGWRRLGADLSGIAYIIMGGDSSVDQVTDSQGRTYFTPGTRQVNTGTSSLGPGFARIPMHQQSFPKRPRGDDPKYTVTTADPPLSAPQQGVVNGLLAEYQDDYAQSKELFIVDASMIGQLTFSVSSPSGKRNIRAAIHQDTETFEVKMTGPTADMHHVDLTMHSAASLGAEGISVATQDHGTSAVLTYGVRTGNGTVLHRTGAVEVSTPVRFRASEASAVVTRLNAPGQTTVVDEKISMTGRVTQPAKPLEISTP